MGGSGTPAASYPSWIEPYHTAWMGDLDTYLNAALLAGSPWTGITPYDPNPDLNDVDSRYALFTTEVDAIDPAIDWNSMMASVKAYWDSNLADNTSLQETVTGIDHRLREGLMRSAGRLAAGMSSINSVQSSTFLTAMAILERGYVHDLAEATVKAHLGMQSVETGFLLQSTGDMMRFMTTKLEGLRAAAATQADNSRIRILANREFINEETSFAHQDATYELSLFQHGANLISGLSGASLIPKGTNPMGSALSGALTGASVGAAGFQMGGQVGAITTIAGALLGGVGGYLNSL